MIQVPSMVLNIVVYNPWRIINVNIMGIKFSPTSKLQVQYSSMKPT